MIPDLYPLCMSGRIDEHPKDPEDPAGRRGVVGVRARISS